MIRETVDRIRTSLKSGQFTNEASISQGIVLPVLQALDWPVFDTSVVTLNSRWKVDGLTSHFAKPRDVQRFFLGSRGLGRQILAPGSYLSMPFIVEFPWRYLPTARNGVSIYREKKDSTKSGACTNSIS